jgi:hypothetical protein
MWALVHLTKLLLPNGSQLSELLLIHVQVAFIFIAKTSKRMWWFFLLENTVCYHSLNLVRNVVFYLTT